MEIEKHRLAYVDALRGFAIMGVIVYHCFLWTGGALPGVHPLLKQVCDQGGNGVQLFFLVSAFTLAMSIHAARSRGAFSPGRFFRNRFFRIVPLYWIAILFYVCERRIFGGEAIPWLQVAAGATFTNGFVPGWMNAPVTGGWSIMMEVYFYLLLPLLMGVAANAKSAAALVLFCLAVQVAFLKWVNPLPPDSAFSLWKEGLFYLMPTQAVVFALGLLLFRIQPQPPVLSASLASSDTPAPGGKRASLILIATGALLILVLLAKVDLFLPSLFLFSIAYMFIALGLSRHSWGLLCNRFTCSLGKVSYSAYLCHFAILDLGVAFLLPWLRRAGVDDSLVFLGFTGVAIASVTGVSLGLYHGLERPIQRLNRAPRNL